MKAEVDKKLTNAEVEEIFEGYKEKLRPVHDFIDEETKAKIDKKLDALHKWQEQWKVAEVIAESEDTFLTELLWDEGGKWDALTALAKEAPAGEEILLAGLDIVEMLLEKNISYGNSAFEPLRLFSKLGSEEGMYVRVDDKLSRLKNNQTYPGDNDIDDLIGYLILLKVARRKNG